MLDAILSSNAVSTYDFREYTNPRDPLAHLFADWVPYYRLKHAIARVLKPRSIFEIGVRYGYSARAFLDGSPEARYTGLDLDVAEFGGELGAIDWARSITSGREAQFIVGNSQQLRHFPGDLYDLIHVDGQQDGYGTLHDLGLALAQGRHVLVDGYLWTGDNFNAVNEFLHRFRSAIECWFVIPGYAGEIIIRPHAGYLADMASIRSQTRAVGETTSAALRNTYTSKYFLEDCGGYAEFQRAGLGQLGDLRLIGVAEIAGALKPQLSAARVVDLGCGRGELSAHFARCGAEVTAIDYSADAIAIAQAAWAEQQHGSGPRPSPGRRGVASGDRSHVAGDLDSLDLEPRVDLVPSAVVPAPVGISVRETDRRHPDESRVPGEAEQGPLDSGLRRDGGSTAFASGVKRLIGAGGTSGAITFIHDSILTTPLPAGMQLAFAVDVVEHLAPSELDTLYARVSDALAADGVFVVHTFPNHWLYKYEHQRKRRAAARLGARLPLEPRTQYELLMHINEQNPRVLLKQLRRHFAHVLLWFGDEGDVAGSLNGVTRSYLRRAKSLYAVAAKAPIDASLVRSGLRMEALAESPSRGVSLCVLPESVPAAVAAGSRFTIEVEVLNGSGQSIRSFAPHPLNISYHWLDHAGRMLLFDGLRTPVLPSLSAGERRVFALEVVAPSAMGEATLDVRWVQEGVRWSDDSGMATITVR